MIKKCPHCGGKVEIPDVSKYKKKIRELEKEIKKLYYGHNSMA